MSPKTEKHNKPKGPQYPSAELVKDVCFEDYKRLLDTYDKIYEKVNIALVLCGVLLISIVPTFDYTMISKIVSAKNNMELFFLIFYFVSSFCSVLFMTWAVIQLLILMKGKQIYTVDTLALRNNELYREKIEDVAMWLIDKFTVSINDLKQIISKKQSVYNSAIVKVIIAIITFTVSVVMSKGVN